jgi:hypothetical protein
MTLQTNQQLVSTLLAYLFGQPSEPVVIQTIIAKLQNDPVLNADVEAQLKTLLSWKEDPAWLEAVAAYREGTLLPSIVTFLPLQDLLEEATPHLLTQFELLTTPAIEPEIEALPPMPGWIEQWQQQQADQTPQWLQAVGYEWQFWRETGRVVIRLLKDVLQPSTPAIAPIGVKGHVAATVPSDQEIVRRIRLPAAQLDEREIEAVLLRDKQTSERYTLLVNVQTPERWPDLSGVIVSIQAGAWQSQGSTNQQGEVQFEGVPAAELDTLTIEVLSS